MAGAGPAETPAHAIAPTVTVAPGQADGLSIAVRRFDLAQPMSTVVQIGATVIGDFTLLIELPVSQPNVHHALDQLIQRLKVQVANETNGQATVTADEISAALSDCKAASYPRVLCAKVSGQYAFTLPGTITPGRQVISLFAPTSGLVLELLPSPCEATHGIDRASVMPNSPGSVAVRLHDWCEQQLFVA